MEVLDRFLNYVSYETTSDENSGTTPSSPKMFALADEIVRDLKSIGVEDAARDNYGYVYGNLPATPGCEDYPVCCFIAHMDTSPDASGKDVKPRIVEYNGSPIYLNAKKTLVLSPARFPSLNEYVGQELIVTDGQTLLGADDKAGIAEIVSAVEYLAEHPELPHGRLAIAFTPDEEIGEGADHFNLKRVRADFAYTVDGGALGELEYENFNAASARAIFHGRNIHPGEAKNKMVNAALLACEFINMLPPAETPSHTEGYEGFFHVNRIQGDENQACVNMLIRDHDRARFEARKQTLLEITEFLQHRHGDWCVELRLRDSYYNMKEVLISHMELVTQAKQAFKRVGVEPKIVPIRGGTDGARLSYMGLPCPNLSTGGLNFHGVFEYLPVQSLEKMVEVIVELVKVQTENAKLG